MNKIFNVNLGGYPVTIDEDAYIYLNKYLDTIRNHFSDSEGCDEIIYDIEVRMAELFQENMKGKSIVGVKDLENVIKVMGRPEDFGADPLDEVFEESTRRKTSKNKTKIRTGRRLFRDPDEKVLGGVCSGIAAYLGITDPLWVRIVAVVLLMGGGLAVPIYIILWAIVPEARTSGDKLAMKGEPINVSNIARTIEDELLDLSDKITEISKDFGSKKKILEQPLFLRKPALREGSTF